MESTIVGVYGREILDSRGNPTVEVEVQLQNGIIGRAMVPSGASTGEYEAVELRDGNSKRYMGKGVLKAIRNVNEIISSEIVGMNALNQLEIDKKMIALDATPNKAKLGANAILGVSMAVAKAAAMSLGLPLYRYLGGSNAKVIPTPMMNILNGGSHADNNVDIQEFMVMPLAKDYPESLRMGTEIYHSLKKIIKESGLSTGVGDEGGFAPNLKSNEEALELIMKAIKKSGYKPEKDVVLALDVAASEIYDKKSKKYVLRAENKKLTSKQLVEYYEYLVDKYPIISIEDGLDENDWKGFKLMMDKLGDKIQIVGDDLFVTNTEKLEKGIKDKVANSILIKLNQIGTVTETLNAIEMAQKANFTAVISHRSGETSETFISDLAVATNSGQIKTGAPARVDRVSKYNQLLRIDEQLNFNSRYLGKDCFYNLNKK